MEEKEFLREKEKLKTVISKLETEEKDRCKLRQRLLCKSTYCLYGRKEIIRH